MANSQTKEAIIYYYNPKRFTVSLSETPSYIELLELVKASQDTGTGNATKNIGASSLHERHGSLVLHDLYSTVNGALVLDRLSGGHHHSSSDRIDRVRYQTGSHSHGVAEHEGENDASVIAQHDGLESVVETKIASTINNDANARYNKATIQTRDAVGPERLAVNVDEAVELTRGPTLTGGFGVVG